LQDSRRLVAKGVVSARPRLRANRQLPEAIGAWRKAADKGSTSAMVELGVLYGTGSGVARDEPRRAAVRGALRKPAIRAASPILPRFPAAAARRRIP